MSSTIEKQVMKKAIELMADPSHHLQRSFFTPGAVLSIEMAPTHRILRQERYCLGGALVKAGVLMGSTPSDAFARMSSINAQFKFKYGKTISRVNDDEGCVAATEKLRKML